MEYKIQYSKIRIAFRGSKANFRNLAIFLCLAIFLWVYSCASLPWKIGKDDFSRSYAVDFISFHPQVNSALQDYARKHKGNSFQLTRLGNDAVIIRGLYKREQSLDRFSATITVKPGGPKRTRMEIKISSGSPAASSKDLEMAARDLFQIVEKETGIPPIEWNLPFYDVTKKIFEMGLSIWMARISTKVEQAVDVFYIQDLSGAKLEDEGVISRIKNEAMEEMQGMKEQFFAELRREIFSETSH